MLAILCSDIDAGGGVESVSKRLDTELNKAGISSKIYSLKTAKSYENAFGFNISNKKLNNTDISKIVEVIRQDKITHIIIQLNSPYCVLANIKLYEELCSITKLYSVLHNSPLSFLKRYKSFNDNILIFLLKWVKTKIIFAPYGKKIVHNIKKYSTICALSNGCNEEFKKYYGVDSIITPNCFNADISNDGIIFKKTHTIAFLGRMDYEAKNFKLLLDCWNLVENKSDWTLKIIGNGDKRPIINYIKKNKIEAIELSNGISMEEVLNFLEINSILLLTSYHEGFPTILAEAAAKGNAIISTKFDGYSDDILRNNENGYVCNFEAPELSKKIQTLIYDNDLLNTMQKKSLENMRVYINHNDAIENWRKIL